jgi:uncharacterized membrane protein
MLINYWIKIELIIKYDIDLCINLFYAFYSFYINKTENLV